ncbi:asparagine synthase (glutamine-hydrolyzing) [Desulfocastanea catecholica]
MCGICGKLNFDRENSVDPYLIRKMMDKIIHRGPDGSGEYCAGPIGLGHRRLSIIDLNTGAQPMSNEDDTVWVVYNGEIYNYREIRRELEALGHKFKTNTDTEVIVHLYEEISVKCVNKFQGMFAFALWDERKQILFIARDRVGIKPLYFTCTSTSFLFASEIKSMLVDESVVRSVNLKAIDRFLTYHYLPGYETLLAGIYKLDPGHYLTVQDGRILTEQYWDLDFDSNPSNLTFEDAKITLRKLLRRTVKDHMISDVPVGVLLSGGVDSTGILRYAVEQTDKPIHSFTIGFENEKFADERPYARTAARLYGTEHHEISMTADDFMSFLPEYVWHMEEPVCEPPAIALYYVSKLARECSVKVLLSGEGGDEAFGGYPNYRNLMLLERLKSIFGTTNGFLRAGFKLLGKVGNERFARYVDLIKPSLAEYYFSRTSTPYSSFNKIKKSLYNKNYSALADNYNSREPTQKLFKKTLNCNLLNCMLYVDTKTWLPDDLLVKADKMTMATSVELRVPLLDFRVLEMAASLPTEYKVRGWSLKRILKAALKDSVPSEILNRKKTGFPVPYNSWLRNELRDFVYDTVLSDNAAIKRYFSTNQLNKLLDEHQQGADWSKEIFCLLTLELWHQKML